MIHDMLYCTALLITHTTSDEKTFGEYFAQLLETRLPLLLLAPRKGILELVGAPINEVQQLGRVRAPLGRKFLLYADAALPQKVESLLLLDYGADVPYLFVVVYHGLQMPGLWAGTGCLLYQIVIVAHFGCLGTVLVALGGSDRLRLIECDFLGTGMAVVIASRWVLG
jgi:hypothetical protein